MSKHTLSRYVTTLKNVESMVEDITSVLHELHNVEEFWVSNPIEAVLKLLVMLVEALGWCISAIRSQDQDFFLYRVKIKVLVVICLVIHFTIATLE
jgi:hypothetical protein